jgi:heme/copper-type cytochrome/quinol oxidase subunit 3
MSPNRSVDVSNVPTKGFGAKSPAWWGTTGFMIVEGTSLVLCAASYVYLSRNFETWPPPTIPEPDTVVPTISLALLVLVGILGIPIDRLSKHKDRRALTQVLLGCAALQLVLIVLRLWEFDALNVHWSDTAYGSAAWFTMGFHTTLLVADFFETLVFGLIFLLGPVHDDHYEDADEVSFYSWFLVASWIPLYLLLFFSPRWF